MSSLGIGYRGDHTGFTFNNAHSSTLGLTRVSSSNRYTSNLAPSMKDMTVDIPGENGTYYYGTTYNKREFSVSFAFDHLTEEQLRRIYQLWNDKKVHDLIFDEEPYKVWSAKVSGISTIKQLSFDDNDRESSRNAEYDSDVEGALPQTTSTQGVVYKGEGTIKFICFFPWARSRFAYIEYYNAANIPEWYTTPEGLTELQQRAGLNIGSYNDSTPMIYFPEDFENWGEDNGQLIGVRNDLVWSGIDYTLNTISVPLPSNETIQYGLDEQSLDSATGNRDDWALASQIPSAASYGYWTLSPSTATQPNGSTSTMKYYNCGDFAAPTEWWFETNSGVALSSIVTLSCDQSDESMTFSISSWTDEIYTKMPYYLVVDMMKGTIEGRDGNGKPTGILYNEYMTNGNFFQIPIGEGVIKAENAIPYKVKFQYLYR